MSRIEAEDYLDNNHIFEITVDDKFHIKFSIVYIGYYWFVIPKSIKRKRQRNYRSVKTYHKEEILKDKTTASRSLGWTSFIRGTRTDEELISSIKGNRKKLAHIIYGEENHNLDEFDKQCFEVYKKNITLELQDSFDSIEESLNLRAEN